MNKATAPRFITGQRVEVLAHDFKVAGFPQVWMAATVIGVEVLENKKSEVRIQDDAGHYHHQIIGVRGGNPRVRAV